MQGKREHIRVCILRETPGTRYDRRAADQTCRLCHDASAWLRIAEDVQSAAGQKNHTATILAAAAAICTGSEGRQIANAARARAIDDAIHLTTYFSLAGLSRCKTLPASKPFDRTFTRISGPILPSVINYFRPRHLSQPGTGNVGGSWWRVARVADYSEAPPFSFDNQLPSFTVFDPDGRLAGLKLDGFYDPDRRSIALAPKRTAYLHTDRPVPELPKGSTLYYRIMGAAEPSELPDPAALAALGEAMMEGAGAATVGGPLPAAYTYLGQFIAHDLSKMVDEDPACRTLNWRSAALDLDSLFGSVDPGLQPVDDTCMSAGLGLGWTHGPGAGFDDLPRTQAGEAAIADQRNDSNLGVAQFHVAMTKFHQAVATCFPRESENEQRNITRQHFQCVVLFDYLKHLIDPSVYCDVLTKGRAVVRPDARFDKEPFLLPIEFAGSGSLQRQFHAPNINSRYG